jgi:hypothetical protein
MGLLVQSVGASNKAKLKRGTHRVYENHPKPATSNEQQNYAINSHPMREPESPPMGRLDALDVASKKLTIQTEFLSRPNWRVETKVYLGGALKKIYTEDFDESREAELQRLVNEFHQAKLEEIVQGLRARQPQ